MKKIFSLLLFLGLSSIAVAQSEAVSEVKEPGEFLKHIQLEEVQLIDLRTPEEFAAGNLEGAENIDFLSEDFMVQMSKLDKEKPLMIYCRSGNKSGKAAKKLLEAGFKNITDLKGGYLALEEHLASGE